MSERLSIDELAALVRRVFAPGAGDAHLAILIDQPDLSVKDRPEWLDRRRLALEWRDGLRRCASAWQGPVPRRGRRRPVGH